MGLEGDAFRIATARLRLVLPRLEDLSSLHLLRNDPADALRRTTPESIGEVERKLHTIIEDNREGRGFSLALRGADDDRLLGMIGIWRIDAGTRTGEIGYELIADRRGEGLMQEAMAAFLPALRRHFPGLQVEAWVHPDNLASLRLLRKQGFVPTGETSTEDEGHDRYLLEPDRG